MEPFHSNVEIIMSNGSGGQNGFVSVPKDRRLVIEYLSGEGFLPSGQKMLFGIICTVNGNSARHYFGTHTIGKFGAPDYYWFSEQVKLYADPGTTVMLRADRDIAKQEATARISLSGYLVWP